MSFTRKKFLESQTYHEWDWDELQNNIANYYDPLISGALGQILNILTDYLTSAHTNSTTPHPNLTIDNILQGAAYKKLSAAEYTKFLTGFYDILDSDTTVKFGHNRNISGFYFAKGADADGANIYGNDLFSRGYPVYVIVFASPWIFISAGHNSDYQPHWLGYRPSFCILQCSGSDPTGQPEDYIYTDGYGHFTSHPTFNNYALWNNGYYWINNLSDDNLYFRVLLFAYMGA